MRVRTLLTASVAAAVLSTVVATSAQAKTTESIDRRVFDAAPERTAATLHLDGPTAGPLGGAMDVTVTATDGSLPSAFGSCEPVDVSAVLTVSPGEVLTVATSGEACAHVVDGTLQLNAWFGPKDLTYSGTEHKKAKVVGDGLIAAAHHSYGAQASFSATVRW